ncbi:T9SS type A sorting domain-containing protein, partial [candidate division KSB1 bacterium]|nr:T9SS type A sorting domain-containing protein [candidate division KSB1 bacterium]
WYGLEFNHAASNSQVKYCNIRDAQYGIYMIHTNVLLTGNIIEQNTTGLLFEDYADGASIVNQNVVKFNSSYGIRCKTYSDPLLFSCNVIRDNGYGYGGVCGDATSVFDLGCYSDQGRNSIYYNDPYEVNSSYPGTIYARYNWWGSASPSPLVTANVNWQYYLTSDPNPGLLKELFQQTPLEINPAPSITASDTVGMAAVNAAYEIYRKGDYQTAAGMFEAIMDKYSGHFAGRRALASYYKCQQYLQNDATGLARLEAVSRNYPGQELAAVANQLIAGESIHQGDYAAAITRCQEQATQFAATDYQKYAFYRLGTIYWYFLNDSKTGETYFRQLIAAYPDDDLSISALATLGEWKPGAPQKPLPTAPANFVPARFALNQNFPNPFNPATTIRYQLPTTEPVTLKIYNLLGVEILTLVQEIQAAGDYSLIWHGVDQSGQPVPNGIYWLRLEAGRFTAQRKLILLK